MPYLPRPIALYYTPWPCDCHFHNMYIYVTWFFLIDFYVYVSYTMSHVSIYLSIYAKHFIFQYWAYDSERRAVIDIIQKSIDDDLFSLFIQHWHFPWSVLEDQDDIINKHIMRFIEKAWTIRKQSRYCYYVAFNYILALRWICAYTLLQITVLGE